MRKIVTLFIAASFSALNFVLFAQTGPGGVGNTSGSGGQPQNKLWLRADAGAFTDAGITAASDAQTVQQWNDQSSNNCHASQTTAGSRPTYYTNVLNGLPVMRFNGSSNEMLFGSTLDNGNALPMGFFAVTRNTTNPRGLFDSRPNMGDVFRFYSDGGNNNSVEFWNQSPYRSSVNLSATGSVVSVIGSLSGTSNRQLDAYVGGTQIGLVSGNTTALGFTSARLGSINQGTAGWFNGDIAEVVYFSTAINAPQRVIVENYLGAKYGLALAANDYYANTTYTQDLIGIGTSDGTLKHSASNGGALLLTESSTTLNAANEYIFAGHDGTVHSAGSSSNLGGAAVISAAVTTRWAREYRIEKTGTADAIIGFDYAQAGLTRVSNTASDYVLLYRASNGCTQFSVATISGSPDVSVANRVSFTITNANLANGYYTLGLKSSIAATTLYSFNTNCSGGCAFETVANWTTDATGATSVSPMVPRNIDNFVVLTGNTVSASTTITANTATINSGGTLDLGSSGCTSLGTLNGGGTLRLSASSGTLVFPTITTNNHITTSGSTVEYNGAGTYALPASPATYRNLTLSGGGSKSITSALTMNENLTIGSATTFTTNSNLILNGHFTNNGQLNQTAGTTTFSSNVAQNINGSPILTIFNHLTINNSGAGALGTITSTIDFTISGDFTSSSNNTTSFNATNGSILLSSNAAQSVGGAGSGVVNFYNLMTSGTGIKTINRNFNTTNLLTINSSSNLRFPAGGTAYTVALKGLTNSGTFNMAAPGSATNHILTISGNLVLNNASVLNLVSGTNVCNTTFNGTSTQSLSGVTPTTVDLNNVTVSSTSQTSLANFNLVVRGDLTVSGTLDLGSQTANRAALAGILTVGATGILKIGGTNTFPSNYSTNTLTAGSTVEYNGTNQAVRGLSYQNLTISNGSTKTLAGNTNINGILTLNSGLLSLSTFNMALLIGSTVSGTPSSTNCIQATSSGALQRYFNVAGSFTYPMGSGSVYSPLTLNITSATFAGALGSRFVAVRAIGTVAPSQLDASYSITKYWATTTTNISLVTGSMTCTYDATEANATAEPMYGSAYYNGASWTVGSTATVVSRVITFPLSLATLSGSWTAGPSVAFVAGAFYSIANASFESGSTWSLTGYAGVATLIPPTIGSTVNIGSNKTVTASAGSKALTTVNIDPTGILDLSTTSGNTITTLNGSGTLRITAIASGTAVFPTVGTNNFITTAGNTVEYYGTVDYNLPAAPVTYRKLAITGAGSTKLILAATTVSESLILNSGYISLGNLNLDLGASATVTGSAPSATNMILVNGTGSLRKYYDATGSFTFPIGTTGVYTPATVNITIALFGGLAGTRFVSIRPVATVAPNQLDATYSLTKHWVVSSTNLSVMTASLSFTYGLSERNATAEPIYTNAYWNGASWTTGGLGGVASPVVSFTQAIVANLNGNYTAGPLVAFAAGNFYSIANGNFENGSTWSTSSYIGAATVIPPTIGSTVNIGNNKTVTATAGSKTLTTVNIDGAITPGTLDLGTTTGNTITTLSGSGTLRISASGGTAVFPTVTTNNFITTAGNKVEYYGTADYNLPASPATYLNLLITGVGSTKTQTAGLTVNTTLTLNSGFLGTGNFDFTFGSATTVAGSPSASNMIVANGTGRIRRNFTGNGTFNFPIGTTGAYTPLSLTLGVGTTYSGGAATRFVLVRPIATMAPSQLDATYSITKYWATSVANISTATGSMTCTYVAAEANLTAEPIYVPGYYNGAIWTAGLTSGVAGRVITFALAGSTLTGNYTAGPSVAFIPGFFYSIANGSFETGSNWSQASYVGAASVIPPTTGSTVNIGNNKTMTVTAGSKTLTTVAVDGAPTPGTLDLSTYTGITIGTLNGSGTVRISASGGTAVFPTVTTNNFIATAGNTVEYYGTANYNLPAAPASYRNLILTGVGSTKTMLASTTVNTNLTMNSGYLDLAGFNLLFPVGSNYSGTPSSSNMIRTSGAGVVRRYFDAIGSFTFPVGTGTVYTPAAINMTAAVFGGAVGSRYIDVRAVNTVAPSQLDATYSLTKYWAIATTNLSGITAAMNLTYDLSERNATVEPIYVPGYWNGVSWAVGALTDIVSPVVTFNRTLVANLNGNWTAGPSGAFLPGTFYSLATGNWETASTWSQVSYVGAVSVIPPTNGANIFVGNSRTVTTTAGTKTIQTMQIDPGATLDIQSFTGFTISTLNGSGTLRISAAGGTAVFPTVTTNNFITTAGNTVEYYGTGSYNLPAAFTTYRNLTLSGTGAKTLLANTTVNTVLTMNAGILDIGNFNLILPIGNTLAGNAGSASNMIRTSGTGVVRKYFDAIGSYNFQIGTGSVYTPYNLNMTSATFGGALGSRFVDVRAIATVAPSQLDATYSITKYWSVAATNISNVGGSITATYDATEAYATPAVEAIYGSAKFIGGVWTTGTTATVVSKVISFPLAAATLTGNWTAGPNVAFLPGTFYSFATGNYETASTWSLTAYAGPVSPIPPTAGSNVNIGNNRTVTATAGSKTIPTVTIDGLPTPGTLDIQSFTGFTITTLNGSGTLRISAPSGTAVFPTVTTNNFITTAGNTVEYYGTGSYSLPAAFTTYRNLTLSGTGTKTLLATTTVNTVLTMNAGILDIGNFNLILPIGNTLAGNAGSASNMIRTSGTGVVRKYFDAIGSYNFQIGTGSVYSPYNLNMTSATFGGALGSRFVDVRAIATVAPSQLDATYSITKYWSVAATNISNVGGSITATYDATEANATPGVEAIYGSAKYIAGVWTTGTTATVVSKVISFPLAAATLTGNWTAGPNVAFLSGTFYSFATGNYETASTWSLTAYAGPVSPIPPTAGSNVNIGNNRTVTATAGSKTIPTVTIDGLPTPGTLDIQSFTGFTITTLNGSGTLRISAPSGTAVFPTVTTNNFITTAGNTVDYYGSGSYNLPAAPLSYRNLTVSGIGGIKTLGGNTTVNENLVLSSGVLELADRNFTVTGTTTNSGAITDNNDTGTNTFTGNIANGSSGSISTANNSPFLFGGGIANNGTFSKTGTGAVTFNTASQIINGSNPITMSGSISVATNITVTNQNNSFPVTAITIGQNAKLLQAYSAFPTAYTTVNNGLVVQGGFNSLATSNNAGNTVASTTGDNVTFTRNGAGAVYGVRTTSLAPASSVQVLKFDLTTTTTASATTAATLLIGSGFADDNTVPAATARLQINLAATSGDFTITYPDGTPTTSANQTGTQTVIWVINNSASTVTYTPPNLTSSVTLAANKSDVWIGNTRFAAGLAVQTAAQAMNEIKLVMAAGTGTITLNNIQINPLGTINTSALAYTCYQVTPYDEDSITVSFTEPGTMTSSTHFNANNTYTYQLSNSAGSFASPYTLGTFTSPLLSGTINSVIPANYASGTGYRVRVVSSSPISIANDNGTNITINQFKLTPAPSQVITTAGTGTLITASGVGVTAYQWAYYTVLGGTITDLTGKTSSTYTPYGPDFPGAGTYSLVCRMTTSGGCGVNYSNYVAIYINCPLTANLVVNGDFSAGNTGFTSQYVYVVDDPMSNVEMYPEQTYAVVNNPYNVHNLFCNMDLPAERSPDSGGNMLVGNAATSGSLNLWTQNITVTANTDYVLTFNAVSLAGAESSLLFGIYTGCYRTGADISVPFETYNCIWNKYSFQFNSGNNTTIPLSIVNISAQAAGNDIAIDDITVYACASVSSPPFVVANAPYWRGITSDWFNKDNWGTTCSLPTCADDVYVPVLPSGKLYPVINASGATAKTVQIRSGARLTINTGYNLDLCGDFDNSGIFNGNTNTTVTFIGNSNPALMKGNMTGVNRLLNVVVNKTNATDTVKMTADAEITGNFTITKGTFKTKGFKKTISGNYSNAGTYIHNNSTVEFIGAANSTVTRTGSGNFYNVKINKTAATNTVTFNPAVTTIDNQLDLTLGKVVTSGTNEISLANSATSSVVNYSSSSYVNGRLRRALTGANSYDFPVGDATRYELLNMNITSFLVGTSTLQGFFTGTTATGSNPVLNEGPKYYEYVCANGFWTLTPNAQPSSGLFNLTINPVGFVCSGVYQTLAKRPNSGSAWSFAGSTPVSSTQRNGFSSFSEIAQIGAEEPLAVRLISFEGWWNKQRIPLQWKTASERDASHFIVEKSADGVHFEAIGRVESLIKISDANTYNFIDEHPLSGSNYYRLKSVDVDGRFEQSRTIRIESGRFESKLSIFPNPSNGGEGVFIQLLAHDKGTQQVKVIDMQGKEHYSAQLSTETGQNQIQILKGVHLPKGMYLVYVKSNGTEDSDQFHPIKWVVQ